jgi:hypothetical protein
VKKILATVSVLLFAAPLARAADVIVTEVPVAQGVCASEYNAIANGFGDDYVNAEIDNLGPQTDNFISYLQRRREARHQRWNEAHYRYAQRLDRLMRTYSNVVTDPVIAGNERLWAVHLYLRCLRFHVADQMIDAPENWVQSLLAGAFVR